MKRRLWIIASGEATRFGFKIVDDFSHSPVFTRHDFGSVPPVSKTEG
jgi:hypothetical protein